MMDYAARYGLETNPFLKNAKDILLDTTEASEARVRLDYLGDTKGFGVLTGEPGRGKSTAARVWASSLNPLWAVYQRRKAVPISAENWKVPEAIRLYLMKMQWRQS